MKKVKMIKTTQGSQDGNLVETFKADETYDMESSLADVFVKQMKVAHFVIAEKKKATKVPENKMMNNPLDKSTVKDGGSKNPPFSFSKGKDKNKKVR